jgi:hypothetical protein
MATATTYYHTQNNTATTANIFISKTKARTFHYGSFPAKDFDTHYYWQWITSGTSCDKLNCASKHDFIIEIRAHQPATVRENFASSPNSDTY